MGIQRPQQIVQFLLEHHWLTYCQYIHLIQPLRYIHFFCTLCYPHHKHLLMGKVILSYHHMTHRQKAWHLKEILRYATTLPNWYQMYQMNHIQIQVLQILIHRIHLDHHTASIINGGKVQKRIKRNDGVKSVSMNLSKSAQSLHPNYLHLRTSQRSWGSNWMRIHYSARFISYISFMHFKIISNF